MIPDKQPTVSEAAQILMDRRHARTSMQAFTELTNQFYVAAEFHSRTCAALEAIERGDIDRLMIFMPPRSGKSELASRRFPAWCLGKNPRRQVICASYSSDLAVDFGRDVRNLVASNEYRVIFPEVELAQDSQAANRWHTNHGGSYIAAGVGASITGRGADLLNIDDPIKDRKEADSKLVKDQLWAWYRSTAYTRLMPKAAIVLIQCMVGSTRVLMADGSEKSLKDVRIGDEIASYDRGRLMTSKVLNWANQGLDDVLTIKTSLGITVTANERHPFLVERDGELEWVRLKNLIVGDNMVRAVGGLGDASCSPQLDTFGTTFDAITEIVPSGREDVFDIQVADTENFIANGFVTHNTRWAEDDLAGRLLNQPREKWELIEFPAIDAAGNALWPERYPLAELDRTRAVIGEREFSALYQQKPMPDEGTFFQRAWFSWYDPILEAPNVRKYMTSDFAVTADGGDYTSIATHGVDKDDNLYLCMDYWTGQATADIWIDKICDQIHRQRPLAFFGEGGPIRRSIEPFLKKRMRERKAYCRVEWIPSVADKAARARALQARASMGKVKLPNNEHGYSILSQLLSFPAGMRDDDVDMLGLFGRVIDEAHPATLAEQNQERKKDHWDHLFEQSTEENTWRM